MGELEVRQEGGPVTVTQLAGQAIELEVALLPPTVTFLPTYLHQRCQATFRFACLAPRVAVA